MATENLDPNHDPHRKYPQFHRRDSDTFITTGDLAEQKRLNRRLILRVSILIALAVVAYVIDVTVDRKYIQAFNGLCILVTIMVVIYARPWARRWR